MFDKPQPITKVERSRGYWYIETKGSGFGFETKHTKGKKPPAVGDEVICHTVQGSLIRGVTLRGELLYYKTDEELEADRLEGARKHREEREKEFKRNRKKLNEQYDALPPEFQRRVSWFRAHNADFRIEYEPYELSVCTDAVLIATTLKTEAKIKRFSKASYKKQQELVPGMFDGHSGNSFGMAVRLAHLYVQNPLWVIAEHGALTPLVGCVDYGCVHPRPTDVLDAVKEAA